MSQDTTPDTSSTSSHHDNEITSVVDFINAIKEDIDDPFSENRGTEVFYRGHADESWDLEPSIFRSHRGIENEHLLFRDMVAHVPRDFSECKSALDYLVQMQHYGLPTRLLDVTANPLVALYFACQPAGDTTISGIVNAAWDAGYGLAREAENYTPDDPDAYPSISNNDKLEEILSCVGVLAGDQPGASTTPDENPIGYRMIDSIVTPLGKVFPDLEWLLKESADAGKKAAKEAGLKDGAVYLFSVPEDRVKHYDSNAVSILSNLARCSAEEINIYIDGELASELREEDDMHINGESSSLEAFNNTDDIQILLRQIREEKPYFQPLIDPSDLCRTFLVKPKHGNPRILNQAGAFFLFGLELTSLFSKKHLGKEIGVEVPRVPQQWTKKKLIIPKDKKADILKELALLGITESYIYPGMEQYAKELKKKYKL